MTIFRFKCRPAHTRMYRAIQHSYSNNRYSDFAIGSDWDVGTTAATANAVIDFMAGNTVAFHRSFKFLAESSLIAVPHFPANVNR